MNIASDPYQFMQECRRDALYTATKQVMVKYFRAKIQDEILDEQVWDLGDFKEMLSYLKKNKTDRIMSTSKKYLITINPPKDSDIEWPSLLNTYKKICAYKEVLHNPKMVLEQRSEDPNNPYGWHMHIATENAYGLSKSQMITRCLLGLKNITGLTNRNIIDVSWTPTAYEYVAGEKTDDKKLKLNCDKLIRENLKYLDVY